MRTQIYIFALVFCIALISTTSEAEDSKDGGTDDGTGEGSGGGSSGGSGGGSSGGDPNNPSGGGGNGNDGNVPPETTTSASSTITPYFVLSAVPFLISFILKI
nr:expressed protein [Hymenolepis microstoma]